jgi:hypothetical protein
LRLSALTVASMTGSGASSGSSAAAVDLSDASAVTAAVIGCAGADAHVTSFGHEGRHYVQVDAPQGREMEVSAALVALLGPVTYEVIGFRQFKTSGLTVTLLAPLTLEKSFRVLASLLLRLDDELAGGLMDVLAGRVAPPSEFYERTPWDLVEEEYTLGTPTAMVAAWFELACGELPFMSDVVLDPAGGVLATLLTDAAVDLGYERTMWFDSEAFDLVVHELAGSEVNMLVSARALAADPLIAAGAPEAADAASASPSRRVWSPRSSAVASGRALPAGG